MELGSEESGMPPRLVLEVGGGGGDVTAPTWPAGSALTANEVTHQGATLSWTATWR